MNDTSPPANSDCPPKFYKYRSLSGDASGFVERIICQHKIYFPPAISFNDPFDCRPTFCFEATDEEIMSDYMRVARKHGPPMTDAVLRHDAMQMLADQNRNPRNQAVAAVIQDEHAKCITHNIGVFCVSTINDDILMWSHYADSHKGICLEFDGLGKLMAHAQKVFYTTERRSINPYRDDNVVAMEKTLLTKADHWSYEREWRLIAYKNGPGEQEFRMNNLTGIIFGAQAAPETVQKVITWVRSSASSIKLYQARISPRSFTLIIEDLKP